MSDNKVEDFLSHYGVLGMHWGKHKVQPSTVSVARQPSHEDHALSRQVSKTPLHQVSTKDLAATNKRLQQEKTFRDLKSKQHVISKGETYVKAALAIAGTAASVYALSKSPLALKMIEKGKPAVEKLLQSKGKHTLHYVAPALNVVKQAAKHL